MCLAVPMELLELFPPQEDGGREGLVRTGGLPRRVRLDLVENPRVGDHLLVHAGFAIQVLDPKEAEELLLLFAGIEGIPAEGSEA